MGEEQVVLEHLIIETEMLSIDGEVRPPGTARPSPGAARPGQHLQRLHSTSRRSFLTGACRAGVLPIGQDGRYAAFSCQGLIHRFRRYLTPEPSSGALPAAHWYLRCTALLGRLRIESSTRRGPSSVMRRMFCRPLRTRRSTAAAVLQ